ncbi:MAG: eukaryotic-like serine/threonine-protein kinase [Chthoniobacter sp.]|nr:eukaryotic-like serine/threonine-protein kinase [Chthoniobacter sp.]
MLRIIGRGAYGEIWLARSLTGALRAVKVVHRSTFEDERAFNREFKGMSAFEPFSRAHRGFVDVLHVGRGADFFYYIMELADDCETAQRIDPDKYVPRTLKTELQSRRRLPAAECIEIGVLLTQALESLHAQGLTHRDIKPANIIFVRGAPKLADIGLVAATGQHSFVGTEGYVAPEGPGSAPSDLFSLGKVLYEISTGKDRLDFPSVNTDLAERDDKGLLGHLNDVLLRACANDVEARYASATEMLADLHRVQRGEPIPRRRRIGPGAWAVFAVAVIAAALTLWHFFGGSFQNAQHAHGALALSTQPPGAMIVVGDRVAHSPAVLDNLDPGKVSIRVMLADFEPVEKTVEIKRDARLDLGTISLVRSSGAVALSSDPAGAEFELRLDGKSVRSGRTPATLTGIPTGEYEIEVRRGDWKLHDAVQVERGQTATRTFEFANGALAVSSDPAGAEIAVDGTPRGVAPLQIELPSGEHEVAAAYRDWPTERRVVTIENHHEATAAFDFHYGSVKLTSAPGGATVLSGSAEIGETPLLLEDVKPGAVEFELRLPGYQSATVRGSVLPRQQAFLAARLEKKLSPEPGQRWENSLGMQFVPVGPVRFCIWETRVRDYAAFCEATGARVQKTGFAQSETDPAVKVNWYDAEAFCKWLTEKERSENLLEEGQRYRLPTDLEWSAAAGLRDEVGGTAEERDGKVRDLFPWGKPWPPPAGAGNYADVAAKRPRGKFIEGYNDGFAQTAPAGSFPPNELGLCDLGGNVWEWCEEGYKGGTRDWGVLRGGSWANSARGELLTSYRNVVDRSERDVIYGFRCVLVSETAP